MKVKSADNKIGSRWRGLLLHPLFFQALICVLTFIQTLSIILLNTSGPFTSIKLFNFSVLFLSVFGLILAFTGQRSSLITHIILITALITPALNIIVSGEDLRLSIFALPFAYLLQVGLVSHQLSNTFYYIYNFMLLVGLLLPMTIAPILIEAYSTGIQIILVTIILMTAVLLIVLYIWHRTNSFLLMSEKRLIDKIGMVIQRFSQVISRSDNIDKMLNDVAHNIIPALELEDCVIYLVDEQDKFLIQKAAFGFKSSGDHTEIINPIKIKMGEGIVGTVAASGNAEIVHDTSQDKRYILDDAMRYSELAVPIIVKGKVVGVIDSEHHDKNFFNEVHLYLMQIISSLCASKIIELEHRELHQNSVKLELESKKLQEINTVKSRFISNLSHDLKTPLTLILGPSKELLKYDFNENDRELVELINANGKALKSIIDELLELNEMAFLSQDSAIKDIDFGLLMTTWEDKYHQRCQQKNIRLSIEGKRKLMIPSDQKKLSVIVYNLFDNALKFTPEGGELKISYGIDDGKFYFVMEDSGPGIAPDQYEKVFERFYKNDPMSDIGTGIGLSVVRQLTDSLGGYITISKSPMGGARFKLLLKCSENEKDLEIESAENEVLKVKITEKPIVLIVEDHKDLRQFIQLSLENEFVCVTAEDGKKGYEIAEKLIPDLIISDLMLPELTGEELCKKIRDDQKLNHIPIIVLSAKSMTLNKVELYNLGAENYLTKPFEIEELKAIINNTIRQRANFREKFRSGTADEDNPFTKDPFLIKVQEIVEENLKNGDFSVTELSGILQIGRNQFQRKIKMLTDLTPVEFVRYIRLKKANELLQASDLTISEIAFEVGFNNLSYFTRSFKNEFGCVPSEIKQVKNN